MGMRAPSSESVALVGRLAPDFRLDCATVSGPARQVISLDDYRGRWLVLLFYPRDFSLVCPTELSALSHRYDELFEVGADVLAVSTDDLETHRRWLSTPRAEGGLGPIRFPLGSDPDGSATRTYHCCLDPQGIALRALFVIDPNGVIQYQVVHNINVGRRTDEILRVLTALQTGGLCAESWTPGLPTIDTRQLRMGAMVSHYRIERKLGDGGFASVYLAYDQTLRRNVALKLIRHTDGWTPNLLDEARAAAALNHPNVCTLYGVDDSEGMPMIVMEHLEGRPLTALVAEGPSGPERVGGIARQIAAGMTASHAAGVIHGDLKPANVFFTDSGTVKILDFGLAAQHRGSLWTDPTVAPDEEAWGRFAGTPSYMAPEQADGGPATAAGDVFSFGVLLYELLTGRRAFGGSSVLQVLSQVRACDPDSFAVQVDDPYAPLLRRMLVPDPRLRTITMRDIELEFAE